MSTLKLKLSLIKTTDSPTLKSTFSSLLTHSSSHPNQLKQIHALLLTTGLHVKNALLTQLLTSLTLLGDMPYARQMFDAMHKPRPFLWNTLIKAYVKNNMFLRAVVLYAKMRTQGVGADKFTFPFVFKACGKLGEGWVGRGVHGHAVKFGVDADVVVITELMVFYAKVGEAGCADCLFESMGERDLVAWNALMSAYEQNGSADRALELFGRMRVDGIKPDSVTLVSALSACARLGCLETGKEIEKIVASEDIERNVIVDNARLDLYAKCGDMAAAGNLFRDMTKRNVVSWSTMIGGYAINGESHKALNAFSNMQAEKVQPNNVTFLAVLSACSHGGLVNQGRRYFEFMVSSKNKNIRPKLEHYACMVDLLGRAGLVEEAYDFIKSMPIEADAGIWGALLGACTIHQHTDLGQHVADILLDMSPDIGSYRVLLSNIYATVGRWGDVEKVRLKMRRKCVKKVGGYSSVESNDGMCVLFYGGDRSHPLFVKIYNLLEDLNRKIRDTGYVTMTNVPLHYIDVE